MKYQEVKNLEDQKIQEEIRIRKKQRFNIRLQKAAGEDVNLATYKKARKEIARLMTEQSKRNNQKKAESKKQEEKEAKEAKEGKDKAVKL